MMLQDKAAVIYGAAGGMRDYQVPRQDLPKLAQATAERPRAKANPRPERRTSCSTCWRRCGDRNSSEMSRSTPILTTHAASGGGT